MRLNGYLLVIYAVSNKFWGIFEENSGRFFWKRKREKIGNNLFK
jgi:hypothetical protein